MASKNVILKMKIEDVLHDIFVRSGSDNIIVDSLKQETLATRLAKIASDITNLQSHENDVNEEKVNELIKAQIDALINGAPEAFDTLKEIADYINTHEDAYEALQAAINNKVDKEEGKGLSKNDFTDALLGKLNGIAEGATKTEKSTTNGNIKINNKEVNVYTHPTGNGNTHIPAGGGERQILRYGGSPGTAKWVNQLGIVRSGVSEPEDLENNELFIKILE